MILLYVIIEINFIWVIILNNGSSKLKIKRTSKKKSRAIIKEKTNLIITQETIAWRTWWIRLREWSYRSHIIIRWIKTWIKW